MVAYAQLGLKTEEKIAPSLCLRSGGFSRVPLEDFQISRVTEARLKPREYKAHPVIWVGAYRTRAKALWHATVIFRPAPERRAPLSSRLSPTGDGLRREGACGQEEKTTALLPAYQITGMSIFIKAKRLRSFVCIRVSAGEMTEPGGASPAAPPKFSASHCASSPCRVSTFERRAKPAHVTRHHAAQAFDLSMDKDRS